MSIPSQHSISRIIIRAVAVAILMTAAQTIFAQEVTGDGQARATSVITGRVVSRGGEPLVNANVSIFRLGTIGAGDNLKVDSNGSFKTEPLAAGLYRVAASMPGYTSEPLPPGSSGFQKPGDSVTLTLVKGGVITGTIKDSNNAPVIAVAVRAFMVRDRNGKVARLQSVVRERPTDDRGVYRLYGLPQGTYVISAGGSTRFLGGVPPNNYETDAPTYAPSSTRDTAVEITVNSGDEITADIQYRGEQGHAVSGTVLGLPAAAPGDSYYGASVSLLEVRTGASIMGTTAGLATNSGFAFYGVPDGEYELHASQSSPTRDLAMSAPKRINVLGADVTGINLTLAPLGSIEGRVIVEADAKNACGNRRDAVSLETIVYARRNQPERTALKTSPPKAAAIEVSLPFQNMLGQGLVDARGAFAIKNLHAGNYRIDPREPASGWYVRSIVVDRAAKDSNISLDGVTLKSGQRVAGLFVTIAEGAATLRGRLSLAERESISPSLRVYLAPAERESAANILRFYELRPEGDGSFVAENIAPGKYWIIARPMEENDFGILKSIRQDSGFRSMVLREAETAKKEISFKPCEMVADFELPYVTATSPR